MVEILNLLVELIDAIVWPGTVLFISIYYKNEIVNAIKRLKWFKYKDFEGHFNEDLKMVEKHARKLKKDTPKQNEESECKPEIDIKSTFFDRLHTLAETSPRGAILEAWIELENSMMDFIKKKDPDFSRSSPYSIIKRLETNFEVDSEIIEMLNHVRNLRNQAVHTPEFVLSDDEAHRYIDVIQLMNYYFTKNS